MGADDAGVGVLAGLHTLPADGLGDAAPVGVGSLLFVDDGQVCGECVLLKVLDGAQVDVVSDLYDCRFMVRFDDGVAGVLLGWLADSIEVLA